MHAFYWSWSIKGIFLCVNCGVNRQMSSVCVSARECIESRANLLLFIHLFIYCCCCCCRCSLKSTTIFHSVSCVFRTIQFASWPCRFIFKVLLCMHVYIFLFVFWFVYFFLIFILGCIVIEILRIIWITLTNFVHFLICFEENPEFRSNRRHFPNFVPFNH